jgi:hypothetical protein
MLLFSFSSLSLPDPIRILQRRANTQTPNQTNHQSLLKKNINNRKEFVTHLHHVEVKLPLQTTNKITV